MRKQILSSLLILLASKMAFATAVKADKEAADGCQKFVSLEQAQSVMKEFNIKTSGAKPEEVRALGTGLTWVLKLNGGRPPVEAVSKNKDGFTYKFQDGKANSHQRNWGILINRGPNKNYGKNVAQLMHELGHLIGNQGGYRAYRNYMGGAKLYCKVSTYSDDKPNEQFAEVFAAFVTKPELMTGSKNCATAYKFFSRVFFSDGEQAKTCD